MTQTARYLWHQRLAWLLMIYFTAIGAGIAAAAAVPPGVAELFRLLATCAIVMTCVKDSALRGRPMPYSWRLPMVILWPVGVFLLEWRARRWWGLLWVAVHGFLILIVAGMTTVFIEIARQLW
jgi:hypothetical protein